MTLQEIEAFLAVVQYGSMGKAAESLQIAQPTLSHRIKTLEAELGTRLLTRHRGRRDIVLTQQGASFVSLAHRWKLLWTNSSNTTYTETVKSTLSIAASQSICSFVMSDVYWHFSHRNLPVNLLLTSPSYVEAFHLLECNDLDFAFYAITQFSPRVASIPIFKEQMVFICGMGSSYKAEIHPSELAVNNEILIGWPNKILWSNEFTLWHNYWFGYTVQPYLLTNNLQFVESFINKPDIWVIVPFSMAEQLIASGKAEPRTLLDAPPQTVINMMSTHAESEGDYYHMLLDDLRAVISDRQGYQLLI